MKPGGGGGGGLGFQRVSPPLWSTAFPSDGSGVASDGLDTNSSCRAIRPVTAQLAVSIPEFPLFFRQKRKEEAQQLRPD
jgi:hypothetical protein